MPTTTNAPPTTAYETTYVSMDFTGTYTPDASATINVDAETIPPLVRLGRDNEAVRFGMLT